MRAFPCIILGVVLSIEAAGQTTQKPPAFDIADIHASPRSTNPFMQAVIMRDEVAVVTVLPTPAALRSTQGH